MSYLRLEVRVHWLRFPIHSNHIVFREYGKNTETVDSYAGISNGTLCTVFITTFTLINTSDEVQSARIFCFRIHVLPLNEVVLHSVFSM